MNPLHSYMETSTPRCWEKNSVWLLALPDATLLRCPLFSAICTSDLGALAHL